MSYNGSGTFVVNSSGQPVVTGTVISSTAFNALTADLATGLSTAITKDGQTTTTARIVFAQGVSSTLVTDATSATTGSIITAGGISCQKAAVVGTLLGVGMAPSNVLDITQNANSAAAGKILNSSSGASAYSQWTLSNGTSNAGIGHLGTNYTASGLYRANGTYIYGTGAGGVTITTEAVQPIYFGINGTEVARFGSNGTFAIGTTDTTTYAVPLVIYKSSGTTFVSGGLSGQGIAFFMNIANANGYNAAQACSVGGGYSTVTNRSANFGGTVNASGADYAEYMTKADGCGIITKGSICGIDVNGELTDKFSIAHSFVIKSTNPSYVGGDTWGSIDTFGDHPSLRGRSGNETDAAYQTRITDFETKADAARQKVDRIAFSGQVPVNVTGATVGDYIVPVAGPDNGIAGEAVTNPTFDQYRAAVGRVWKILEDGRAFVSVKVS